MPRCESQPISGGCHLLIRILPIIRPWGSFVLVGAAALGGSTVFRASAPSRGFIFQAQVLHPVVAANRGKSGTSIAQSENVRAWNDLHRWHGRGPAYLIPAKVRRAPARSAVSECRQARILWKLWADATRLWAPKQQSNLRRCCGAPNRGLHNTNHWGAVIPNMSDPGKIRVPNGGKGFVALASSGRMIELRRNSYERWRGTRCSSSAN